MASVFTSIINGDLPARFVWKDDTCVAFLSINPLKDGHVLVVPRAEIAHWIDLPADTWAHISTVAHKIGQALQAAYSPVKVGMMLAGLEVPHVHIHLVPVSNVRDLDFDNQEQDPSAASLNTAAATIRQALRNAGHAETPAEDE